ncbi:alginate export family protein [Telmatobacter bradus]|uniref:alginate export family protein n=1 Tax=Telmatobacter bradus TaxID=474953 RepID=UPI003B43CFE4
MPVFQSMSNARIVGRFSLGLVMLASLFAATVHLAAQQEIYPRKEGIEQSFKVQGVPSWMTLNMELRARTEEQTALGYVSGKDRLYELERVRGGLEVRPAPWLTFFAQFHDLHALGLPLRDTSSNMRDTFDLRQGYLNFHYQKQAQLFVGRQELKFGDERVIGISDWTQTSRTFDAIDLRLIRGKNRVDMFSSSVVTIAPTSLDKHGAGLTFHGIEGNLTGLHPNTSIQPFFLVRALPRVTSLQKIVGSETEYTFGSAWEVKLPFNFDTSGTGDLQRGSYSNDSIHSGSGIVRGGYRIPDVPWKFHLQGEYDYATGNPHVNLKRISTFDQQFPSNHNVFGLVDLFGFENIKQERGNLFFEPTKTWMVLFQAESLHVANRHDNVYSGSGSSVVTAPTGGLLHDGIGTGFDASSKYIWHKSYVGNFGVGHFFPGYVMTSHTHGAPLTLVYAQLTYRFKVSQ